MAWLAFAMITVVCFGSYGALLHTGQICMKDKDNGRYKAFLFVGVAYFIVAVLAPLGLLLGMGSDFQFTGEGAGLSLIAGACGAIGAFGILLAFGAKGVPVVVMSIVFSGAPIINAIASMIAHPPEGGIAATSPFFFLGILVAATGGCLVTLYKPPPAAAKPGAKPEEPKPTRPPTPGKRIYRLEWLERLSTPKKETRMVTRFPE